jgi:hypothetical protein
MGKKTGISYFDPGTEIYPSVAAAMGTCLPPAGMYRSPEDENPSSSSSVPRQMEPLLADGLQGRRIEDRYREALVAGRRHSMADPCRDGALGQISLLIFPFCSPTIGRGGITWR